MVLSNILTCLRLLQLCCSTTRCFAVARDLADEPLVADFTLADEGPAIALHVVVDEVDATVDRSGFLPFKAFIASVLWRLLVFLLPRCVLFLASMPRPSYQRHPRCRYRCR